MNSRKTIEYKRKRSVARLKHSKGIVCSEIPEKVI